MGRPRNHALRAQVRQLHEEGKSPREITEITGYSSSYVYTLMNSMGMITESGQTKTLTENELDQIVKLYRTGTSMSEAMRQVGATVTRQAVNLRMHRLPDWDTLHREHTRAVNLAAFEARRVQRASERERRLERYKTVPVNRRKPQQYTDEYLDRSLVAWRDKHGEPVSVNRYDKIADPEFPSGSLYTTRFGSWNAAKTRAGLAIDTRKTRRVYSSAWSREEMLTLVAAFLEQQLNSGESASYDRFDAWLKAQPERNLPSAQTVRNRVSPDRRWLSVLAEAQSLVTR